MRAGIVKSIEIPVGNVPRHITQNPPKRAGGRVGGGGLRGGPILISILSQTVIKRCGNEGQVVRMACDGLAPGIPKMQEMAFPDSRQSSGRLGGR